jgi:dethiobiotin synthetase
VGKTVVTAHWLHALRYAGRNARAMKPFCSGDDNDVQVLQRLQPGVMTREQCNPYYFKAALAPGVAAQLEGRRIRVKDVLKRIRQQAEQCETLLVEGAGGIMVPLGRQSMVLDLIGALNPDQVIVVAKNQLGTLNHTLLTTNVLRHRGVRKVKVMLVEAGEGVKDESKTSNKAELERYLGVNKVISWPWMGLKPLENKGFKNNYKKVQKVLAEISE